MPSRPFEVEAGSQPEHKKNNTTKNQVTGNETKREKTNKQNRVRGKRKRRTHEKKKKEKKPSNGSHTEKCLLIHICQKSSTRLR
jgi:hypothetical protein